MKIVILERNSVGPDISVDILNELGEVTAYPNTVSVQEVRERTADAEIVVANKSPINEESLGGSKNVKLVNLPQDMTIVILGTLRAEGFLFVMLSVTQPTWWHSIPSLWHLPCRSIFHGMMIM